MHRSVAVVFALLFAGGPAAARSNAIAGTATKHPVPALVRVALVGGANVVRDTGAGRHVVMIVGTRGNVCTGTALARDLVLTAAHCVAPAATYRVLTPGITPPGLPLGRVAIHPRY